MEMTFSTADLTDHHPEAEVVQAQFQHFGKQSFFCGQAVTVKAFEDNSIYRDLVNTPGNQQVLIVDAGASLRYAMLGDMLAESAMRNKWAGIIIYGAIRDSAIINTLDFGVKSLGTCPRKSVKNGEGQLNIAINIAGATILPGNYIYADTDGVLVSPHSLL